MGTSYYFGRMAALVALCFVETTCASGGWELPQRGFVPHWDGQRRVEVGIDTKQTLELTPHAGNTKFSKETMNVYHTMVGRDVKLHYTGEMVVQDQYPDPHSLDFGCFLIDPRRCELICGICKGTTRRRVAVLEAIKHATTPRLPAEIPDLIGSFLYCEEVCKGPNRNSWSPPLTRLE